LASRSGATTPPEAERKFVEDTLVRGEAAKDDEKGELPLEATHETVEEPPGSHNGGALVVFSHVRWSSYRFAVAAGLHISVLLNRIVFS